MVPPIVLCLACIGHSTLLGCVPGACACPIAMSGQETAPRAQWFFRVLLPPTAQRWMAIHSFSWQWLGVSTALLRRPQRRQPVADPRLHAVGPGLRLASKLVRGVAGNAGADAGAVAVAAAAAAAAAAVTTGRYCRRVSLSSRRSSWTSCLSRAATPLFRSRRTRRTRPRVPSPRTSCLPRCSARSRPARFPSHPLRSRA